MENNRIHYFSGLGLGKWKKKRGGNQINFELLENPRFVVNVNVMLL